MSPSPSADREGAKIRKKRNKTKSHNLTLTKSESVMLFKFFLELVVEGKRIGSFDFHVIDIDAVVGIFGGVMISRNRSD